MFRRRPLIRRIGTKRCGATIAATFFLAGHTPNRFPKGSFTFAMNKSIFSVALMFAGCFATFASSAQAQSEILSETYGRGVHAFNSGSYIDAYSFLSMAIDNGMKDPRAYYYRGIVAYTTGRQEEAQADWLMGAQLEAQGQSDPSIGRSLARVQGSIRIQLEKTRQTARLTALSNSIQRSNARYGELGIQPKSTRPAPAVGLTPPAVPAAVAADNPFADDIAGQATIESDDAFSGAMEAAAADAAAAPAGAPGAAADAGGADLFKDGGGDASPFGGSDDSNPFGGGDDAGMDDVFGGF